MVKYINRYDRKDCYICGLGIINNKKYEFYTDGEPGDIWVDIHKAWISDNDEAWDKDKSKQLKTFTECVNYINQLFDDDITKLKPIGFKKKGNT